MEIYIDWRGKNFLDEAYNELKKTATPIRSVAVFYILQFPILAAAHFAVIRVVQGTGDGVLALLFNHRFFRFFRLVQL